MPNLLMGLKYQSQISEAKTEQQLIQIFSDLRNQYNKLNKDSKIFTKTDLPVSDFKHFLRVAVQKGQSVTLIESGDISGLNVHNASLEYDLLSVGELTEYWDLYQDGSCHSCLNHYYEFVDMDSEHACKVMNPMDWSQKCPKYKAYRMNSEGKPARRLDKIILAAAK